ncbi:MAG: hypothetical protein R3B84_03985 [Zavarzinella sp.]
MRFYIILATLIVALIVIGYTGFRTAGGQTPPGKLPDAILKTPDQKNPQVIPVAGVAPISDPKIAAPAAPTNTRRFVGSFPTDSQNLNPITTQLLHACRRSFVWLGKDEIFQVSGQFIPGINLSLGIPTQDDHFHQQATAAWALARAARCTGEQRFHALASQAILAQLGSTTLNNQGGRSTLQIPITQCDPIGSAALLALAIAELPNPSTDLQARAVELTRFLAASSRGDGRICCDPNAPATVTEAEFAFLAYQAMLVSFDGKDTQLLVNLKKALEYYEKAVTGRTLVYYARMSAACSLAGLWVRDETIQNAVFRAADAVITQQYASSRDRDHWAGGFTSEWENLHSPPTISSAEGAKVLIHACQVIRQMERPDLEKYQHYQKRLIWSLQFVTYRLQYTESDTLHFDASFRPKVVGAFRPGLQGGSLRTTDTASTSLVLSDCLLHGFDRQN